MDPSLETLFNKKFGVPAHANWADIAGSTFYLRDFLCSLLFCLCFLCLRYLVDRSLLRPAGIKLGLNVNIKTATPNAYLEKVYQNYNKSNHQKQIRSWAKQLDWTEEQVENWIRLRLNQNNPTKLDKFCENSWRFFYYFSIFCYGLFVLWDATWLWDVEDCWRNYPQHPKTTGIWWYYMISLGFYLSLNISQFYDNKRKDFWQMFVHHIITCVLIISSWITGFFRIGSLVLLIHDFADISLEALKVARYANYKKLCNAFFGIFTVSWIVSRLIAFPFWIIRSTLYDAPKYTQMFLWYVLFNGILILLLVLHIFWTILIIKLVYRVLTIGEFDHDIRSSSSEGSE